MVAAAKLSLQVTPGAVQGTGNRTGFLVGIGNAFFDQNVFQLALEAGALQALCEKVTLQGFVLQLFADVLEAFLAVDQ